MFLRKYYSALIPFLHTTIPQHTCLKTSSQNMDNLYTLLYNNSIELRKLWQKKKLPILSALSSLVIMFYKFRLLQRRQKASVCVGKGYTTLIKQNRQSPTSQVVCYSETPSYMKAITCLSDVKVNGSVALCNDIPHIHVFMRLTTGLHFQEFISKK